MKVLTAALAIYMTQTSYWVALLVLIFALALMVSACAEKDTPIQVLADHQPDRGEHVDSR